MGTLLALALALVVLIAGIAIYHVAMDILDEGDYFFIAVGFFLLLFAIVGLVLYYILPRPFSGQVAFTSLIPSYFIDSLHPDRALAVTGGY